MAADLRPVPACCTCPALDLLFEMVNVEHLCNTLLMGAPMCRAKVTGNTIHVLQVVKSDIIEVSADSGSPKIGARTRWVVLQQSSVELSICKTPAL